MTQNDIPAVKAGLPTPATQSVGALPPKLSPGGAGDASEASGGVAASGVPEKTGGGGTSTARDVREREESDR